MNVSFPGKTLFKTTFELCKYQTINLISLEENVTQFEEEEEEHSTNEVSSSIHIHDGADCDVNTALLADYDQILESSTVAITRKQG